MDNATATWHRVAFGNVSDSRVAEMSANGIVDKSLRHFKQPE
jgi:hypothetical protein